MRDAWLSICLTRAPLLTRRPTIVFGRVPPTGEALRVRPARGCAAVLLMLVILVMYVLLSMDVTAMVVQPIESMVGLVRRLAENPTLQLEGQSKSKVCLLILDAICVETPPRAGLLDASSPPSARPPPPLFPAARSHGLYVVHFVPRSSRRRPCASRLQRLLD
jgi:hypothetical protein